MKDLNTQIKNCNKLKLQNIILWIFVDRGPSICDPGLWKANCSNRCSYSILH